MKLYSSFPLHPERNSYYVNRFFAWVPTKLSNGDIVWLETVEEVHKYTGLYNDIGWQLVSRYRPFPSQ